MDLKVMFLPETTVCSACHELIEEVLLIQVADEEATRLKAIKVICPECGVGRDLGINVLVETAAGEVMKHLR